MRAEFTMKKMAARGMIAGDTPGVGLAVNGRPRIVREDGTITRSSTRLAL